jgi:N-acetylglucosaminyl-diphospho-decaprenol L-rhamnosyltransferase
MDANPRVGIAGSRLEMPEGQVQASPFRFQGIATELDRGLKFGPVSKRLSRWAVVPPTPKEQCEAEWVSGASMIIRREVIEAIGLLDEGYFTYFDDIDYCLSARKAGWPTWFVPQSRIIHLEGQSTGINQQLRRRAKYWFQARRRFFLKHYGPIYTAAADAALIFGLSLCRVRRLVQNKPEQDPPHLLLDSILNSVFLTGFALRDVENPSLASQNPRPVTAVA